MWSSSVVQKKFQNEIAQQGLWGGGRKFHLRENKSLLAISQKQGNFHQNKDTDGWIATENIF